MERITRCFADWVRTSGYACTMVVGHTFDGGPYHIESDNRLQVLQEQAWGAPLADEAWDFIYVIGAGLSRRTWIPRLRTARGIRVVLDLDRKRKWLEVTDVLHCEAPRAADLPRPHVVATPDPFSTMPRVRPGPPGDYVLTAFNPYGSIKGHQNIPAFLTAQDQRLVWCYDLTSWTGRSRKLGKTCRQNIESVLDDRIELVEAPSQTRLYELYAGCAGYVCFSRDESLGFSMLDAVAWGKPLCARDIGICRGLDGFRATEDFSNPVFGSYELPAMMGYGALFENAPRVLGRLRS